ncbi:MAG: LPXTG cell wall anchor domain-containing protein, partial [Inconstantimicrobium porci]|uniref:LPXTG cell wall anchor domain-containing protein n=1 Tax=Inconstantimicrobium porci TaxID=2652291 RepID=UPI002A91D129
DVKINDNKTFSVNVTLNEGVNTIPVYAADKNGKELMNYGLKVFCDTIAPIITIDNGLVSDDKLNTSSHKITLKGKVSDNFFGYKFYINGEQILSSINEAYFGAENNEKEFNKDLNVNDGDIVTLMAVDDFGNKVEQKYTVKINPGLGVKISAVADGGLYNKDVTPVVEYNEKEYDVTMTLNGAPYTKGQAITEQGDYTLVVNSALKGEKSPVGSQTFKFTIDKTAPIIKVEGVENGKLYNKDVTPVITVEQGATVTEMTLDGKEYDKAVVSTDGVHKLVVKAVDKAGNETKYEAEFTLDKTAPEITVEGVQDGFKYENEVKAVVKANEKTSELTVTLDGKAYDGSVINTDGKHELKVTAVDLAGNKSEKTVTFTVEMPKPANQKPDPSKKPGNNQGKPGTVNPTNDDNAGKVSGNANVVKGSNGTGVSGTVSTSGIPKTGSFVNAPSIVIAALIMIVTGVAVVFTKRKRRL